MDRVVLTDAQWAKIEPFCLGKRADPERSGRDNRLFIEAVLWIARTGSPWRYLPERFGNLSTAFQRFRDWRKADVFKRIFDALTDEPDMEYAMVDATSKSFIRRVYLMESLPADPKCCHLIGLCNHSRRAR